MSTFWLKVAGFAVVAVVLFFAGLIFFGDDTPQRPTSGRSRSADDTRAFSDQVREDREKLDAPPVPTPPVAPEQTNEQTEPGTAGANDAEPAVEDTATGQTAIAAAPQFRELSPELEIEAEKQWEIVMNFRSMGRLPGTTYKKMIDICRDMIDKYPETIWQFKAKRALADLPDRYKQLYNITEEETDTGDYK